MLTKLQKHAVEQSIIEYDRRITDAESAIKTRETVRELAWNVAHKARLEQMLFLGIITYSF